MTPTPERQEALFQLATRLLEDRRSLFDPIPYQAAMVRKELTVDEAIWLSEHARVRVERKTGSKK